MSSGPQPSTGSPAAYRPDHPLIARALADSRLIHMPAHDGLSIPVRVFGSSGPKRPVVMVHGLQSHSGWFGQSASYLAGRGHPVYAFDRMGSGLSRQPRGDLRQYKDLLGETSKVMGFAAGARQDQKVHLLAHCFGAVPAILVASTFWQRLCSLILATPAVYTNVRLGTRERLLIGWAFLTGRPTRTPIPYPIEWLTDQADYLEFIRSDHLALRSVTGRFMVQAALARLRLTLGGTRLRIPVFVAMAGRDRLVDNRRTQLFIRRVVRGRSHIRIYGSATHILEFSPDRDAFLADLGQWIDNIDRDMGA